MPDRRIALDARGELGPALLHHLVRRGELDGFGLGPIRTRDWGPAERWRLGSGGGARLALEGQTEVTRVEDLDAGENAQVCIGELPEFAVQVVPVEDGMIPSAGEALEATKGPLRIANGHAQALATALGLLAARLELRWVTVAIQVARTSQAAKGTSLERSVSARLPQLAGKFRLNVGYGEVDRDRLIVAANLGGAPGEQGVLEGIGDALGSPMHRDRAFEAVGELSRANLQGQGQLALLTPKIQAIGPLATVTFDYDARDLQAARVVEAAVSLLPEVAS